MILTILLIVGAAALLSGLWKFILAFLNGPVRDLLERIFGADKCKWYSNFLVWCDKQMTAPHRIIKMQWKKFKDTVVKVESKYTKNADGTYTKNTESIVRTGPASGKRVVVEETVGWKYLPDSVRDEMIRQRANEAALDDRELVAEKVRQRAAEEGIALEA